MKRINKTIEGTRQIKPGFPRKYPHEKYLDGNTWKLVEGEDYSIGDSHRLRKAIHQHCIRKGIQARTHHDPEQHCLYVQRIMPEGLETTLQTDKQKERLRSLISRMVNYLQDYVTKDKAETDTRMSMMRQALDPKPFKKSTPRKGKATSRPA
jgi:hypothetical protein